MFSPDSSKLLANEGFSRRMTEMGLYFRMMDYKKIRGNIQKTEVVVEWETVKHCANNS